MAIRLIASDIDGTLLRPDGQISDRVQLALQAASRAGCLITLATGRSLPFARPVAQQIGIHVPIILHSGALICEADSGKILYECVLDRDATARAIARVTSSGLQPLVFSRHVDWLLTGPPGQENSATARFLANKLAKCQRLSLAELASSGDARSVTVLGPEKDLVELSRELKADDGCHGMLAYLPRLDSFLLDILGSECSKAAALAFIAARHGISLAETMAVGDHANDVPMILAAGIGVAMGNAPASVQAAADWITASNAEDGLAVAIERFVLNGAHT